MTTSLLFTRSVGPRLRGECGKVSATKQPRLKVIAEYKKNTNENELVFADGAFCNQQQRNIHRTQVGEAEFLTRCNCILIANIIEL